MCCLMRAVHMLLVERKMPMARKRSAATKKAIRTRKIKSAGRKAAKKKRRAVTGKVVATKKLRTAPLEEKAVSTEVQPTFTTE